MQTQGIPQNMAFDIASWVRENVPPDEQLPAARAIRLTRKGRGRESASSFWLRAAHNYTLRCSPSVAGNDGHRNAFRVACILIIGFNLPREAAFPIFQQWNLACQPPWSLYDLKHKLEEAEIERDAHANPGYLRDNLRRAKQRNA